MNHPENPKCFVAEKSVCLQPSFCHVISELFDFFVPDRVLEPISEETERLGDDFRGRFLGSTFAAVSSCFALERVDLILTPWQPENPWLVSINDPS